MGAKYGTSRLKQEYMALTNSIMNKLMLGILLTVASACADDNAEDLMPQQPPQQCDTNTVTFSGSVAPILATNCYACHAASIAEGGVVLSNYNGVKAKVDEGRLIGAITHAPGFVPMPQGAAKLSDCDIEKIKKWVNDGALNN
jgi:cytochrome c553